MSNSVMNVVKGVTFGMMAGMAAGYVGSKVMANNKKTVKKRAVKALRNVENVLDTASSMLR
ncbi:MAG: hypothetical protein IJV88_01175 [Ruminococcus sp.]|nr:hypothetical protein [Ruminococcus sp.]